MYLITITLKVIMITIAITCLHVKAITQKQNSFAWFDVSMFSDNIWYESM